MPRLHDYPPLAALISDLDETLCPCASFYIEAKLQFAERVHREFPRESVESVRARFHTIDTAAKYGPLGLKAGRLPNSMVRTYEEVCADHGRETDEMLAAEIRSIGESVFEADYAPFPGAVEVLERYKRAGVALGLYTKGDPDVQWQRKILPHGLDRLFEPSGILVTEDATKTVEQMTALIERVRPGAARPDGRVVMLGDSLRDDIRVGREAGCITVWVRDGHEAMQKSWAHDAGCEDERPDYTIRTVHDLPKVLAVPRHVRARSGAASGMR